MERCPICNNITIGDSGQGYKRCYTIGCSYRIYSDGSTSFLRYDGDKIRRIKKHPTGIEETLREFNYP